MQLVFHGVRPRFFSPITNDPGLTPTLVLTFRWGRRSGLLTDDGDRWNVAPMTKPRKPDGLTDALTAQQRPGRVEPTLPDGGSAVQTTLRRTRKAIAVAVQNQPLSPEQVWIWEQAVAFCVRHLPTLWTAGEPQREPGSATRWIVPIVLGYPDGYEGKLGEMAWDELRQEFTVLTDKDQLAERARMVASSRPAHGPNVASP